MSGPVQTQIILVPMAGVDWNKSARPKPYRRHKIERWGERKTIPVPDHAAIRRKAQELREAAKRAVDAARPQIQAMLARAARG
jgi:hypothetical protein